MFYSKSTGGFYVAEVHGTDIPNDAIEITEAYHAELLNGQVLGKVISSNEEGYPVLQEPAEISEEQLASDYRKHRNYLLSTSDWTALSDSPLTGPVKTAWKKYRQALRDIPSKKEFPKVVDWPVAPN